MFFVFWEFIVKVSRRFGIGSTHARKEIRSGGYGSHRISLAMHLHSIVLGSPCVVVHSIFVTFDNGTVSRLRWLHVAAIFYGSLSDLAQIAET